MPASGAEPLNSSPAPDESAWTLFTQQRLPAYTPFLSPKWHITLYMLGGALFLSVGLFLLNLSRGVVEHTLDYSKVELNTVGELPLKGGNSEMELSIEKDMEPPIWVYYQLSSFHQNHRRYVKSRDDKQLQAAEPYRTTGKELKACEPAVMNGGRPLYPCGLVARSVFNDTFAIIKKSKGSQDWKQVAIDSSAKAIAWKADVDSGKFTNYDPEGKTKNGDEYRKLLDMWIVHRFPPVRCVQSGLTDKRKLEIVSVAEQEIDGVKMPACTNYNKAGEANCDFVDKDGNEFNCDAVEQVPDWGVESGHFMVWMRVAGLPDFRKLWGRIDEKLEAGTKLKVYVASHFPVESFGGKKAIVISTSSALGGRNEFLGWGYLLVGICCVLFGTWFLWKHLKAPDAS